MATQITVKIKPSRTKIKAKSKATARAQLLAGVDTSVPEYVAQWVRTYRPFQLHSPTGLGSSTAYRAWMRGNTLMLEPRPLYAFYLNYGVPPHSMRYLLDRPKRWYWSVWGTPYQAIPPVHIPGVGFRRPSEKAMENGKWWHPGWAATFFVERSLSAFVAEQRSLMPTLRWQVHW